MARKTGDPITVSFLEKTPEWNFDDGVIRVVVEVSTLKGWRIEVQMRALGVREVVSLSMTPLSLLPDGGITRRSLDRLSLAAIVRSTAALFEALDESGGIHMSPALRRSMGKALVAHPHPGRRGFPDRYYAVLAADYVDRVVARNESVPSFAKSHHLSETRTRNLLTTARKKGYLTEAPPGRVGGELTAEAQRLLDEEGD